MKRSITLGYLNISERGKALVNDVLETNRLSYGKYTQQFENSFAQQHGCSRGIFCNSGTSALQIALAALKESYGYKDGDEVLVPALTFIATSNVVLQNGLKPVFVDVDPHTFNMNPNLIKEKITSRTRAIIPVHLFGLPADMKSIMQIARNYPYLAVIEDSCETMFAYQDGQPVGSFGDLACFSTYVAHLIVGGVGGIVTTKDAILEKLCRSLMAHGRDAIYTNIDQDDTNDNTVLRQMVERRYNFERVGYSYRATEFEAAIALSELEHAKDIIFARRANAALLSAKLQDLSNFLQLPHVPDGFTHSFMMYPMVLKSGNRDDFLLYLEENGIETRYAFPLLSQPIYRKLFPGLETEYPVARHLSERGFFIGIHQGLSYEDIDYVSKIIHVYFGGQP